jgi:hypothetical protein
VMLGRGMITCSFFMGLTLSDAGESECTIVGAVADAKREH